MAYRLAAVYAHPDDDTYGLGGTLALHAEELDYTLIVATSGEAGQIADPSLATRESLAGVREAEEREALAALGLGGARATVHFLRYPDMGLADVSRNEQEERVAGLLAEAAPQVVVTFGPEGVTKHPDHTTISQVATEAFHRARAGAGGDAFQRLFYNALPRSLLDRFWHSLRERGIDLGSPEGEFMPRGVPDHTISVRVDCRRVFEKKIEAVRAHRTQSDELATIPEDIVGEFLGQEFFVQAWPPVTDPAGPTMSSIFERLEG